MFSQVCVIPSVHGGKGLPEGGLHPVGSAWGGSASGGVGQTPQIRYYGIWSTSGWYASYWNAFLLLAH